MSSNATVTLNNGHKMPLVGFGAWKVDNDTCAETIYNAIKSGYRLIDCAQDYGNEVECGQGLKRAIDEGIVKRDDVFITSKLWNTFHAKEHVEPMLKRSLADWGLDYFDLFHIHFPLSQKYVDPKVRYPPGNVNDVDAGTAEYEQIPLAETWKALEAAVNKGLTKSIGISNCNVGLIRDLLAYATIRPAVLQIEHHPYLVQQHLLDFCERENIKVTAYSTFGPQSYLELETQTALESQLILEHPTVAQIAKSHDQTPAQVILRWCTQRGIAVIPKSNNKGRLQQNLAHVELELSKKEIEDISNLNINVRFNDPNTWNPPMPIF